MSLTTYTAKGTFDSTKNATVNVCIPAEPSPGDYNTAIYNLSKVTSKGHINVIFCHFSDHLETPMDHISFDYQMDFNINALKNHVGAIAFDERKSDALFIFFHNNEFCFSDRELYFDDIERLYNLVKSSGNQSQDGLIELTTNASINNPRKVGLSLVVKLDK